MFLLGFLLLNRRRQKSGFIGDVLMTALTESKRKKKRWRSLAMCVWTIVSWGVGLTSTFGSLSYNQSQPKTHGMVRSACFLAATISFSVMPRHAIFSNPCGWLLRPLFLCYVARIQMQVKTQHKKHPFQSSCRPKLDGFLPVETLGENACLTDGATTVAHVHECDRSNNYIYSYNYFIYYYHSII